MSLLRQWDQVSLKKHEEPCEGDKMSTSMLTHTNAWGRLVIICNHQADSPPYLWPNLVIVSLEREILMEQFCKMHTI